MAIDDVKTAKELQASMRLLDDPQPESHPEANVNG